MDKDRKLLFWVLSAVLFVLLIHASGCTPQSQIPFDPTKQTNMAREVEKQSGRPITRDRMECHLYYKAALERCYIFGNCTTWKLRYYERKMDQYKLSFCRMRLGKFRW